MRSHYKIVHTSASTDWGGTEKRILDEGVWMADQGHQVVIVAPKQSPLFQGAKQQGLSVYPLDFKGFALGGPLQRMKEILSNEQPNILNAHGHTDGRISLKAAKKMGVPCRIIESRGVLNALDIWQNRNLYRKLSHYTFTLSAQTAQEVKQIFKLKEMKVFTISRGVDPPQEMIAHQEARQTLARSLGLDPDQRFVGLLEPWSGAASPPMAVLKAFGQLHLDPPLHLIIPKTQDQAGTLEKAVENLNLSGRVHLVGLEDEWTYYRSLSCGILGPAVPAGGMPRGLIGAMHAGCPVVACQGSGTAELLTHGRTGLLYDPSSPDQMADAIFLCLTQEAAAKERICQAREAAGKHHTLEAMGRDILRIYRLHQVRLERQYHQVNPELYY